MRSYVSIGIIATAAMMGRGVRIAVDPVIDIDRAPRPPRRYDGVSFRGTRSEHGNGGEIARRKRQAERVLLNRRNRCIACNGFGEEGQIGLSRRGRVLVERDGAIRHLNGKIVL